MSKLRKDVQEHLVGEFNSNHACWRRAESKERTQASVNKRLLRKSNKAVQEQTTELYHMNPDRSGRRITETE